MFSLYTLNLATESTSISGSICVKIEMEAGIVCMN